MKQTFGFNLSSELIKVELPPSKIWEADVSSVSPSSLGTFRFYDEDENEYEI